MGTVRALHLTTQIKIKQQYKKIVCCISITVVGQSYPANPHQKTKQAAVITQGDMWHHIGARTTKRES